MKKDISHFASLLTTIILFFLSGIFTQPVHSQIDLFIDSLNVTSFPVVRAKIRVLENNITVTGLDISNFIILEDDSIQAPIQGYCNDTVKSSPVSVMLVIDRSGSMGSMSGGLTAAKIAAKNFLDRLSPNDEAALISFGSSGLGTGVSYDQNWTLNKTLVKTAIDQLSANGGTPLWKAVSTASQYTRPRTKKKVLIVLTDGDDNAGTVSLQEAIAQTKSDSVIVYTIGLGNGIKASELTQLARATGGEYYPAPSNSDLDKIYQTIATKITTSGICELWYTSKINCWNGSQHRIEIIVTTNGRSGRNQATFTVPIDSTTFSFVDLTMKRDYVSEQDSMITIPLTLTRVSPNRPPKVFQFTVDYAKTSLELVSVDTTALTGGYQTQMTPTSTGVTLSLIGTKSVSKSGDLVLLNFHALPNFESNKSEISISKPEVQQFCTVATSSNGLITISGRCERAISANSKPQKTLIHENTPNPFNPSTIIRYTIGQDGKVTMKLFDAIGREIKSLVNQEMKKGEYIFNLDGSELSTGKYFVKLNAANGSDVRQIVLIK